MVELNQLEAAAKQRLKAHVHLAISRGIADSVTFEDNLLAWRRIKLAPRILAGAPVADTRIKVLGTEVSTPILLAPAGLPRGAHPDGEIAAARGAEQAGTLMVLSHFATRTIE